MEIINTDNPLHTKIVLDEFEQKIFWYKIKIAQLLERISEAEFLIDRKNNELFWKRLDKTLDQRLDEAEEYLNSDYLNNSEKPNIDDHVNIQFSHFLNALQEDHFGDCTCKAISCCKCAAEEILGISTLIKTPHNVRSYIQACFSENQSLGDVIDFIKNQPQSDMHTTALEILLNHKTIITNKPAT